MNLRRIVTPIAAGAASIAFAVAALTATAPQPNQQGARVALAQEAEEVDYTEEAAIAAEQADATYSGERTVADSLAAEQQAAEEAAAEQARADAVAEWSGRIDAYLAGTPLSGYGATFAQVAMDYGIDPRLAPAIAMVESGAGSACFNSHNAWGYGNYGWSDWDSAINGYVSGLYAGYSGWMAEGDYGLTVTPSMASVYSGYDDGVWYSTVLGEMSAI